MVYELARPRIAYPPTISEVQSWSFIIRDLFIERLMLAPFFINFTPRKNKALPIMPNQLPLLGVYFVSEDMSPDGDANTGEIRFVHQLRLGFSIIVINNDPVNCEAKLDQGFWAIMNTLWRDPALTNFLDARPYPGREGNPDNVRIEGVTRGNRRHVFGTIGKDNETPIGELQYDATISYRADYPPVINDQLLLIHQETVPLRQDGTVPPADEVPRVVTEYAFELYPPPVPQPLDQKE